MALAMPLNVFYDVIPNRFSDEESAVAYACITWLLVAPKTNREGHEFTRADQLPFE